MTLNDWLQSNWGKLSLYQIKSLLARTLNVPVTHIVMNADLELSNSQQATIQTLFNKIQSGMSPARALGAAEFYGLEFALNLNTLEPRPDSETLIDAAQAAFPDKHQPLRILDCGTGTGCLPLALLSLYPNAHAVAVDKSIDACLMASQNACSLGYNNRFHVMCGNWLSAIHSQFDLIISNPPYIPTVHVRDLAPIVQDFDPVLALDGGTDGYDAYKIIFHQSIDLISDNGILLFEAGYGQLTTICNLGKKAGFKLLNIATDLTYVPRGILFKKA